MIPRSCRVWKIVPTALAGGDDPPGRQSRCSKSCGCGASTRAGARTSWPCCSAGRAAGIATSTVGRILTHLKARGQLVEPLRNGVKARRRPRPRPHAVRKPKDYAVLQPGDLVQVDTLEVRPLPGVVWKHFTARDLVSRWDVIGVYSRATATTATSFLTQLRERMPFPVRAIQVDGGSEFQAQFEQACERWGLSLFVLPPRSPKLNGHVERAQRTHTEEFYELIPDSFQLPALNRHLRAWERIYNTVRPHQTLGYRTPLEFLTQNQSLSKEPKCH